MPNQGVLSIERVNKRQKDTNGHNYWKMNEIRKDNIGELKHIYAHAHSQLDYIDQNFLACTRDKIKMCGSFLHHFTCFFWLFQAYVYALFHLEHTDLWALNKFKMKQTFLLSPNCGCVDVCVRVRVCVCKCFTLLAVFYFVDRK